MFIFFKLDIKDFAPYLLGSWPIILYTFCVLGLHPSVLSIKFAVLMLKKKGNKIKPYILLKFHKFLIYWLLYVV